MLLANFGLTYPLKILLKTSGLSKSTFYYTLSKKDKYDLDNKKKKYSNHFKKEITQYEIVQYLINTNHILKETYNIYQAIIKSIKNKDTNLFIKIIEGIHNNISDYMKTSLKTYKTYKLYIINSLNHGYNNGVIEGTNNLIKCIKRISFGFKSFSHFKTRILLVTGIYKIAQ